jgi:tetratricopeptide (TPR) repeat protein
MLAGRVAEARKHLESAAALLDQLRAAKPDDAEVLKLAASVAPRRADLMEYEGHAKDGLPFFQQARQWTAEYARIKGDNASRARLHLISTLVANSLLDNQRYEEALAVLRKSDPIIDGLLAAEPDNPLYLRQKMSAMNYVGAIYDNESGKCLGKPAESVAANRQYVAMAKRLTEADPHNASARLSLAIAHYKLSYPLGELDPAESLRMAQRSLAIFDEDLAGKPHDFLLRSRRARALRHLAYALDHNRRRPEARQTIEQAIAAQRQLLAETPSDGSEREQIEISQKVRDGLSN